MEQPPSRYPPPPQQPTVVVQQRSSAITIVILVVLAAMIGSCILFGVVVAGAAGSMGSIAQGFELREIFVDGDQGSREKVAIIPIEGVIMETTSTFKEDMVDLTRKRLKRAADDGVKAIILSINSPGGGVTASARIHRMISDFKKEERVPVVALMGDLAASGGYYVAMPADWIVAAPSTITASIGVILTQFNLKGLMEEKLGIRYESLTSAPQKDILSPFRDLTQDERQHLEQMIQSLYLQFIDVVVEGRQPVGVTAEKVRELQSTILIGSQALEHGLVDQLGYMEEALAKAQELAKSGPLRAVRYDLPPPLIRQIMGAEATVPSSSAALLERLEGKARPSFLYLWPGWP